MYYLNPTTGYAIYSLYKTSDEDLCTLTTSSASQVHIDT